MARPRKHPELIYKTNRHCCYDLQYHIVLMTKYRHPVIKDEIETRLREIIEYLLKGQKCNLIEFNTNMDHVHILFDAKPQTNLSVLVNNIKTVTSRRIRQEFNDLLAPYYWKPYFWSESYFIGTVSDRSRIAVQQYIKQQKENAEGK